MKPLVVALVAGLIATALPVGAASAADPPEVVAGPEATAPGYAAAGQPSRYRFYNGYWWYWTPDNRWLCYVNGQWVSPGTPAQTGVPVYAYPSYNVVPQPYYDPYLYGYGYPYPYSWGGIYFGGGYGGYWHGGYGYGGYGHPGYGYGGYGHGGYGYGGYHR
jgi:hypothetical protein